MSLLNRLRDKSAPYILATGLTASLLAGCEETKTEYSPILHEDAVVSDVVYTPSRHGSGSGIGPTIDFDGNIGIGFTDVTVNIPKKYAVVFECQHGKFISEGTDQRHKDLWGRLKENMEVDVTYKERFRSVYDTDKDGDGQKDLISRALVGYDFLDAQPKKK